MIASWAIGFVICLVPSAGPSWVQFLSLSLAHPWSILTYAWTFRGVGEVIGLFMTCYFLINLSSTLQSMTKWTGLLALYLVGTIVFGLCGLLGAQLTGSPVPLFGPYLVAGLIVVLWCSLNRAQRIMIYWVIPMPAPFLAALTVLGTLLFFGREQPIVGVLLAAPLAASYFFADKVVSLMKGMPVISPEAKKQKVKDIEFDEYMTKVRQKESDRAERDRLRALFENSFKDDEPEP